MTEGVRSWLLRLVVAALILAIAESVTPEGLPKKVEKLVGGLLVMLVMVQPLLTLFSGEISQQVPADWLEEYAAQEELETAGDDLLESIIMENCQAYIEAQARELGAEIKVSVTCRWQEELPVPAQVTVTGALTEAQRSALEEEIEQSFGIAAGDQSYREAVE